MWIANRTGIWQTKTVTAAQLSMSLASGSGKNLGMYAPAFSWQAMLELAVSLAITVLVVQNGQNGQSERADFDAPAV